MFEIGMTVAADPGDRVERPCNRAQQAASDDHRTRPVFVDEIAFNRHEPCFGHDEDRERDLNRGTAPLVFFVDRIDEQCPAVLHVGNHCHADHAEYQLHPR